MDLNQRLVKLRASFILPSLLAVLSVPPMAQADEGMWLFNQLPEKQLSEKYQFTVESSWAEHLMRSSVRFNSGGSGSFVSSGGLVLTNHHVAADTLAKLSSSERDLIRDGFLAKRQSDELPAPDLELNQLIRITVVTDQVNAAVTADMDAATAAKARRAEIAKIEKQGLDESGLRSDVVTLFGGAEYHLYQYKRYTDVRLVWAPETQAAFFGGDADNFEYPRYNLDATLFRVYDNGKPLDVKDFLAWRENPVEAGELIFVSGHPGRTQRIFTEAALRYLRDEQFPYVMNILRRWEVLLQQYSLNGKEAKRRGRDDLFGIQNSRKAYSGMLQGLQDPTFISGKRQSENELLKAVKATPELEGLAAAWQEIAELQKRKRDHLKKISSFQSRLYEIAETINLLVAEDAKPNPDRLREFGDAGRASLLQDLYSDAAVYSDLEIAKLADELARIMENRGGDDPLVKILLAGKSPQNRARELVTETGLADPEKRKALVEGGVKAVNASQDPMIQLARKMETVYREEREEKEAIDEAERQAYAKVTKASVAVKGQDSYPDATFTLRLAFGLVSGYDEDGKTIAPLTNWSGAFEHAAEHEGEEDFTLPRSWQKARKKLTATTPLNFVSTADIIGGNSGSPVVDRDGKLVGLIFDGNIQSLTSNYRYDDRQGRAVSVAASAIREGLEKIYGARDLAKELGK